MRIFHFTTLQIGFVGALGAGIVVCAQPFAASAQELKPVQGVFRVMAVDAPVEGLYYKHGTKDIPLEIKPQQRSGFYQLPTEQETSFYRIETAKDGTVIRKPALDVNFSQAGALPLVMIGSARENSGHKLEATVVRDDLDAFPMGTFRIVNFTDVPLEAVVDGVPSKVTARSDVVVEAIKSLDKPTVYFQLMLNHAGRRDLVFASNWSHSGAMRIMVLMYPPRPPAKMPAVLRVGEIADVLFQPAKAAAF